MGDDGQFGELRQNLALFLIRSFVSIANSGAKPPGVKVCCWESGGTSIQVTVQSRGWTSFLTYIEGESDFACDERKALPKTDLSSEVRPVMLNVESLGMATISEAVKEKWKRRGPAEVSFTLIALPSRFEDECATKLRRRIANPGLPVPDIPFISTAPESGLSSSAFIGRDIDLTALHKCLTQTSPNRRVALVGMGGIGKTELGIQYALAYKEFYPGGICWISFSGTDPADDAIHFGMRKGYFPDERLLKKQQVQNLWNSLGCYKTLIIIDDIEYLKEIEDEGILPPAEPNLHLIITSRNRGLGSIVTNHEVERLTEEEGLDLLMFYISLKASELNSAKEVVDFMGGLPLGLEMVGRYVGYTKDSIINVIQRLIEKRDAWVTDDTESAVDDPALALHGDPLTTTLHRNIGFAFELSWEQISPSARKLAKFASSYPSSDLDWDYLSAGLATFIQLSLAAGLPPDQSFSPAQQLLSRGELLQFCLLKLKSEEEDTYYYHPLLQVFFREKMTAGEKRVWGKHYDIE